MKKTKLHNFLSCFLLAFFLCTLPSVAIAEEPIVLKAGTAFLSHTEWEKGFWMFFQRVNKQAKDRLRLNYIGGPEAIPSFEMIEAVRKGIVDIAEVPASYYVTHVPEVDAMKLSRITPAEERERGVYDLLRKVIAEKANAYLLGRIHPGITFHFYTKTKLQKLEDFRGLKVRSTPLYKPIIVALDATPVIMAHAETYTALERGLVDAFCAGELGVYERGWHEHIKYIILPGFYVNEQCILVNLDTWNRIPKDLQKLLEDIMIEVEEKSGSVLKLAAKKERSALFSLGVEEATLVEADKFLDLAYEVGWKSVLQKCPEYGPELKKLLQK